MDLYFHVNMVTSVSRCGPRIALSWIVTEVLNADPRSQVNINHEDSHMRRHRALLLSVALLLLGGASTSLACTLTVLADAAAERVSDDYRTSIVAAGDYQRSLLRETARYMTPLLCAGVRDVVYVAGEPGDGERAVLGWVNITRSPSLLYVNSLPNRASEADLAPRAGYHHVGNVWATAIETLLHESTHAAVNLLNTQVVEGDCTLWFFSCDEATDASQWPDSSVTLARATMERLRLRVSFQAEWSRLHRSFVAVGLAKPHGERLPASQVPGAGFMTSYGGTEASEDIADIVAQVQASGISSFDAIPAEVNRGERADLGCMAFADVETGVPGKVAALYTKILLVRDAGLVSPEAAAACTGSAGIDTRGAAGIHFFTHEGEFRRSFSDGLEARIGADGDRFKFQLAAEGTMSLAGEEHAATFLLTLDVGPTAEDIERVSWPRGIYRLGLLGENTLVISVPDENHVTYHVDDGMVLITSATTESIEGSIVMNRATRPHAPMGVPMAAADLPRVTFRIDGSR